MARELKIERENSKINVKQLTNYLDGGEESTRKRRKIGWLSVWVWVWLCIHVDLLRVSMAPAADPTDPHSTYK